MSLDIVLLLGAAFNIGGAVRLALAARAPLADDHRLLSLFTAGTALVFASMHVYLYFHADVRMPFLLFGTALKSWAFAIALILWLRGRLARDELIAFGLGNGAVAALFGLLIARGGR